MLCARLWGECGGALPGDLEAQLEAESHEAEQRDEVQHQQDDRGDGGPAIDAFRTLQRSFLLDRRSRPHAAPEDRRVRAAPSTVGRGTEGRGCGTERCSAPSERTVVTRRRDGWRDGSHAVACARGSSRRAA